MIPMPIRRAVFLLSFIPLAPVILAAIVLRGERGEQWIIDRTLDPLGDWADL